MIQKAEFKKCELLQDSRFAPYEGFTVFIIAETYLIFEDEIIDDFDIEYYSDIFNIIETTD